MVLFFAVVAHIGWAVGDVFGVTASRQLGGVSMTVWRGVTALAIATCALLPFFWKDFFRLTPEIFLLIAILTCVTLIADFAFFEGLKVGNPSIVGIISASFVAISPLFSILFLGEQLTFPKAAAILVILFGVALCLLDRTTLRLTWGRGEILALVTMIGWGIYYAFIKIPIRSVGWFVPVYLFLLTFPIIGLIISRKTQLQSPFQKSIFPAFLISVLLTSLAECMYNISLRTSDVSFVAPIAASYPALFVLLSSIIFREPMHRVQWAGVSVTIVGIIGLSTLGV